MKRMVLLLLFAFFVFVPRSEAARRDNQVVGDSRQSFLSVIPDSLGSVILGRPTDHSITISILLRKNVQVVIHYGKGDNLDQRSDPFVLNAGETKEIVIDRLQTDTAYSYQIVDAITQQTLLPMSGNGRFHTQRARGEPFVFTVQADSHLDWNCSVSLYERTLENALHAKPDFHIDMGDTSMVGKISDRMLAMKQYEAQRHWLGQIGHSAPLFLVIGNHDGEEAFRNGAADEDGLAVWSALQRKNNFPNPVPDGFYTGDAKLQQYVGTLDDYYSWEWGDALFVVLDPYWYSEGTRGGREPWNMTLGKTQYDWLAKTLRSSKAKFKFVFIHQLVGGSDNGSRGGVEFAPLYEWGGHEKNGENAFATNRPGWEKPIHTLLVETGVSILFHGHDHFFAKQELDGVTYQLVPQPASRNSREDHAGEYGYEKGDFLPSPGHLRVSVAENKVAVDYIRTTDQDVQDSGGVNGQSAYSYSICTGPHSVTDNGSSVTAKSAFVLRSPEVIDGGALPMEFTGDGDSATLPLEWSGAPDSTKSYALIMHHIDREGKTKWYWILYNIPPDTLSLPKNVKDVGIMGNNSINGRVEYAPPHSKGRGAKTYVYTLYALSAPVKLDFAPVEVNLDVLLAAMQGNILATAELKVVYSRLAGE